MTTQIPVKAVKSGSTVTALAEFAPGDTLDPSCIDGSPFATAAQGAKADSAVQPGSLATVATTGAYVDLSGKPTLGTAAATDASAYATSAQGIKADSAVQPAALAAVQSTVPVTSVAGNYTLSNADAGTEVQVNSAVAVTVTVPASGVTYSSVVLVRQVGTGQVTISGTTVKSFAATTKLAGQNALAVVRIDSSTAAYVNGELAAS